MNWFELIQNQGKPIGIQTTPMRSEGYNSARGNPKPNSWQRDPRNQNFLSDQTESVDNVLEGNTEAIQTGITQIEDTLKSLSTMFGTARSDIETNVNAEPFSDELFKATQASAFNSINAETNSLLKQASDSLTSRGLGRGTQGYQAGGGIRGDAIGARAGVTTTLTTEQEKINAAAGDRKQGLLAGVTSAEAGLTKELGSLKGILEAGDQVDPNIYSDLMGDIFGAEVGQELSQEIMDAVADVTNNDDEAINQVMNLIFTGLQGAFPSSDLVKTIGAFATS